MVMNLFINKSAVQKHIDGLKKKKFIRREGGTTGAWIIAKSEGLPRKKDFFTP